MKRIATAAVTALLVTVGVAGCGGTGDSGGSGQRVEAGRLQAGEARSGGHHAVGRLHPARAAGVQGHRQGVRGANPGVKVRVVGGINDDKIIAASRGGKAPDVAQSFSADNSGAFCGSGAWVDLKPYLERDGIKRHDLPARAALLHAVQGHALRAADAGRRDGPLLQRGHA